MTGRIRIVRNLLGSAALGILAIGFVAAPMTTQPARAQLEQLPSVADLAERLLPSVVEISVQTKSDTAGPALQLPELPDNSPFKDFFDEFLKKQRKGQTPEQQDRQVSSMGSGFVIEASGLIVTNNHVVEGAENIEVHFQDSTVLKAELVGRDPKTDLAVLRVKAEASAGRGLWRQRQGSAP